MINFIIYEDDYNASEFFKSIIHEFIGGNNDSYKIVSFSRYDDNLIEKTTSLIGKKIFILDVEVPGKTGLDLAREVRTSGDWLSQIIIVSNFEKYEKDTFTSKLLALNFISKKNNVRDCLKDTLNLAYEIISTHSAYAFQYNGEFYQIPYHDILYFEKDLNDNYCYLVTNKSKYKIKETITNIEKRLKRDLCFFKSHRSCIINLDNIYSIELNSNTITFIDGKKINLLSRSKKSILKKKLVDNSFNK